jgi:hypothetical protein
MIRHYRTALFLSAACFCLLVLAHGPGPAQARTPQLVPRRGFQRVASPGAADVAHIEERFRLGGVPRNTAEYAFRVTRLGRVEVQAAWKGTARELELALKGPQGAARYPVRRGRTPLTVAFDVSPALLDAGDSWTVSIANPNGRGGAIGTLSVSYPVRSRTTDELDRRKVAERMILERHELALRGVQEQPAADGVLDGAHIELTLPDGTVKRFTATGEEGVERSILEDGTVEIRLADGTVKLYHRGGGFTIVYPDGRVCQSKILCLQAQPATPPDLPSDLSDDELNAWLEDHSASLLRTISDLVSGDEESVNYYLEVEEGKTLYEKVNLRAECIGTLVTPSG